MERFEKILFILRSVRDWTELGFKKKHFHGLSVCQGWCGSADPRKRGQDTKHSEADEIKREIEEFKVKKEVEHADMTSGEGIELVPLMKEKYTGKPHKDPSTGYMMSHGLSSTDVTKLADKQGSDTDIYTPSTGVEINFSMIFILQLG